MSARRAIDLLAAAKGGDWVDIARALRAGEEEHVGTYPYDPYADLEEDGENAQAPRQAPDLAEIELDFRRLRTAPRARRRVLRAAAANNRWLVEIHKEPRQAEPETA